MSSKKYVATLILGRVYVVGDLFFNHNEPKLVTQAQKDYLEQTAKLVHRVRGDKQYEEAMFEFQEYSGGTIKRKVESKGPPPADAFKLSVEEEDLPAEGDADGGSRRSPPKAQ